MIWLEKIRSDPRVPEFAKPHPNQESIWARQYPDGFAKVRLDDYPTPELVVDAWKESIKMVQVLAHSFGLARDDPCGNVVSIDDNNDANHGSHNCEGKRMEEADWLYHLYGIQEVGLKR